MKLVCISDVHDKINQLKLPKGDVLIIAGDLTMMGTVQQVVSFNHDLENIKALYKSIVVIAGNHDFIGEKDPGLFKSLIPNVTHYLHDESVTMDGIKFYGSPYQPEFFNWAFNLKRGPELKAKWDLIPNDTDVLITHGPPFGILDKTPSGEPVGCIDLYNAVVKIKPKYHVFGHIHHSYGQKTVESTTFINASSCSEKYKPINQPIIVDI